MTAGFQAHLSRLKISAINNCLEIILVTVSDSNLLDKFISFFSQSKYLNVVAVAGSL